MNPAPNTPASDTPALRPAAAEARAWFRQSDALDTLKSLFLGLVATAIFYEVFPIPFMEPGRLLGVFDNWASELIVGMALWCLFLLALKLQRYRGESRVLRALTQPALQDGLARSFGERDPAVTMDGIAAQLQRLNVKRFAQSLAFKRLEIAVWSAGLFRQKEGLVSFLDSEAEIEIRRLEASFTILQVFIWAIPILGFIGTVHGIGSAVSEFSQFIRTAEGGGGLSNQMRSALAGVTGGLALAFNTTFLALVLVVPIMLLTSLVQKAEEELLLALEGTALERWLPRLRLAPQAMQTVQDYEEQLQRVMEAASRWSMQLEPTLQGFARQAEMLSHQMAGVQPLVKDFTDRVLGGATDLPTFPRPGSAPTREGD
jgi:biopolymer transport protein ExbB/TolQ